MSTTTNIADFGWRERQMLIDLLTAWNDFGLPNDFSSDEVVPMMNINSGNVFLTNADYQVCMMKGKDLASFYTSPYEGKEGFFDDLLEEYKDMHPEDQEWFEDIASMLGREDELKGKDDEE